MMEFTKLSILKNAQQYSLSHTFEQPQHVVSLLQG